MTKPPVPGDRRANIHIRNSLRYRFKFSVEFATHCSPNACQRQPQSAATQCRFTSAEMRMPMGKRMAQHRPALVSAIFALLSLALSCAVSARGAHAAPCDAKPNSPAPEGQHWYYRTDRASGRKCWFLGDVNNQKDAAQASKRLASDAAAQPAAQQSAHRQTMAQAPGETETDSPTGKDWPPRSEAAQLPYMPPAFLVAPAPVPEPTQAEQAQTTNAEANPPAVPASDAASEPEVPAIAQSSAVPAPVQPTENANHTLALATLVFLTTVIFGAALEFMRWLRRRRNRVCVAPDWAELDALYQSVPPSPDVNSSVRHTPPPLSSFAESEKLAEELQKILDELRTRPSFSMHEAGRLVRSG